MRRKYKRGRHLTNKLTVNTSHVTEDERVRRRAGGGDEEEKLRFDTHFDGRKKGVCLRRILAPS